MSHLTFGMEQPQAAMRIRVWIIPHTRHRWMEANCITRRFARLQFKRGAVITTCTIFMEHKKLLLRTSK